MQFFSWVEARRLYAIGLPIFVAQMAQTGMAFVDTALAGQYSAEHMAAVAVAGSVWQPVALLGIGCLLSLSPLSAQAVGSGQPDRAAHLLRQGLWLTLGLSLVLMSFFYTVSWQMESFGLAPHLAAISGGFLRAMLCGLPGFLLFVNQRGFLEGFARTRPAMIIGVLGLVINVPFNYVFIYGKLGMPELGGVGCGVASAVSFWFMALCMFLHLRFSRQYASMRPLFRPLWRGPERFDGVLVLRVLRIGLPGALALFFEVALFALSAILLAPLGTVMVAGHQIALNFGALVFMVPLSISMTATIRVGACLGAAQVDRAKLVARTALSLSVIFALCIALLTVLLRRQIVGIYTEDAAVAALAAHLLLFGAAYQVLDGLQATGIGILRGHNDTRIISVICFMAYALIGLPLGYVLGRTDLLTPALGAVGFWIAYIVALGFGAVCYLLRLRYLYALPAQSLLTRVRR